MLDFWKTILTTLISHLLGWPAAAIVLGIIFKNQVSSLLARLTNFSAKYGSTSVDIEAAVTAEEQKKLEKKDLPAPGSLSSSAATSPTITEAIALAVEDNLEPVDQAARQAMIDFGKGIEVVQAREAEIRTHLARLHFDIGTVETADILIRNLAFAQAVAAAEKSYRLIFGSQLSLLKALNIGAPKTDLDMRPFYERAKKSNTKFYGAYPYEDWRNFLLDQKLIVHDEERDVYGINGNGRTFLAWIVNQGLTEEKPG